MNDSNGNITFGYNSLSSDTTDVNQYFEIKDNTVPKFNFTMFARAVKSNATVCGFHFKIAKTQY